MASYIAALENISGFDCVVVSTLMNHISDLENKWTTPYDHEKAKEVSDKVMDLVKITMEFANDNKEVRIVIIPPTIRTYPKWLSDNFDLFRDSYLEALESPVTKAALPPISDTDLNMDGVHLKKLALDRFKDYIRDSLNPLNWAEEMLEGEGQGAEVRSPILSQPRSSAPNLDDTTDKESYSKNEVMVMLRQLMNCMNENTSSIKENQNRLNKNSNEIVKVQVSVDKLTDLVHRNDIAQHISTARVKEEMDSISNSQRRNVLVLKKLGKDPNLKLSTDYRIRGKEVKSHLLGLLRVLPTTDVTEISVRSIYVFRTDENQDFLQDFRIVCGSVVEATEIRNRILKAKSEKKNPWVQIEINNDPTKATRVRIFLLQAVARKLRAQNQGEDILVNRYSDSPNLIIKKNGRTIKQLTFVDTMLQYGGLVTQDEADRAKGMAGKIYKGSLKDYFLILEEDEVLPASIPKPRPSSVSDGAGNLADSVQQQHRSSYSSAFKRRRENDSKPENKRKK